MAPNSETATAAPPLARLLFLLISCFPLAGFGAELADLIEAIRPAIVGVGTFQSTRSPPVRLLGTGFVVGDGSLVATNAHVLPPSLDQQELEFLAVFTGQGGNAKALKTTIIATDQRHDLALLKMEGPALSPLRLAGPELSREGTAIAFTGFPIGAVLGLYPVTHTGIISALTPIAIPARKARELSANQIGFLRDPYRVYQLDATAYPGNSGSPLFELEQGRVIGIVNKVFVKDKKENLLETPSAISYAIPIKYLHALLTR